MTVVQSWHVQKVVAVWWPAKELWQGEISIEFELRAGLVIGTADDFFVNQLSSKLIELSAQPIKATRKLSCQISNEHMEQTRASWRLGLPESRLFVQQLVQAINKIEALDN